MPDAVSGPFLLHIRPASGQDGLNGPRKPLRRCTAYGIHFIATTEECDGFGVSEQILGYVAVQRSSEMARSLRRCIEGDSPATYRFYHSLDAPCPASANQSDILGYVF